MGALENRYVFNAVIGREIIGCRQPVAATPDDQHVIARLRLGRSPSPRPRCIRQCMTGQRQAGIPPFRIRLHQVAGTGLPDCHLCSVFSGAVRKPNHSPWQNLIIRSLRGITVSLRSRAVGIVRSIVNGSLLNRQNDWTRVPRGINVSRCRRRPQEPAPAASMLACHSPARLFSKRPHRSSLTSVNKSVCFRLN
jgi:hypothetical protein